MIRHIVLAKFRSDVTEETIWKIYRGLSDLTDALPGVGGFTGGRSESPGQIELGYKHGFVIDFDDWAALASY
ncbi:Dabb family protein [Ruegeria sp. AU67]|uniref:Dabb family protein n=1 Tax=Ruegeria sp. AU67 TaxID=2108530 RepID=UPI001F1997F3|nr:Dabb family protein [Ruegeria sp. AU67]